MRSFLYLLIVGVSCNSVFVLSMDDYGHIVYTDQQLVQTSFDHATQGYADKIVSLLKKFTSLYSKEPIDIRQLEEIIVHQAKLSLTQETVRKDVTEFTSCDAERNY